MKSLSHLTGIEWSESPNEYHSYIDFTSFDSKSFVLMYNDSQLNDAMEQLQMGLSTIMHSYYSKHKL